MLLSEYFGGGHQRGLRALLRSADGRERGNDSLAATDITLQQPQHRRGLFEVQQHLGSDSALGAGQFETEIA